MLRDDEKSDILKRFDLEKSGSLSISEVESMLKLGGLSTEHVEAVVRKIVKKLEGPANPKTCM
uniref:EF-hand domain-containing protein n=1 Tax=Mesocestoides corti TaxID=53468 RepID=A0A5K3FSF3_MESCO